MFNRMFHYDADDGGAGGGDAQQPLAQAMPQTTPTGGGGRPGEGGSPATADSSAPDSNAASDNNAGSNNPGSNNAGGNNAAGGSGDEIHLNTMQLSERLERARNTERAALLRQLGYENLEGLQNALQAGQQAIQAQMSEQERQQQALQQAQERAQSLERQAEEARSQARQALLQSQAVSLMSGRFANPQAAFRLLDLSAVEAQEDGTFTGLKEAIDKLATGEPWTLAQSKKQIGTPPIGATAPPEGGDRKESDDEKRARYFGNYGGGADFFKGSGVKSAVVKGQKP